LSSEQPKLVIIGLDGADFHLTSELLAAGRLPNLAKLAERGASGMLKSTYPSFTAPAWTSFITGLWPGNHGIYNFRTRPYPAANAAGYTRPLMDSSALVGKTLWSVLTANDVSVGSVNFPVTYPPERVQGYMVSGMLAGGETEDFVYPREMGAEIRRLFPEYRIDMDYQGYRKGNEQAFLDNLYHVTRERSKLALWLLDNRPVDVFNVTFTNSDRVQHFMWQYQDPQHPCYDPDLAARFGSAVKDFYAYLDQLAGDIMARIGDQTPVFVVSDHGFGPIHKKFNLNKFLEDLGLIAFRQAADGSTVVDWDKTRAYAGERAEMAVFISVKGRDPLGTVDEGAEYDSLVSQISAALLEVVDPETGEKVVTKVWPGRDLCQGEYSWLAPDVVFKVRGSIYQPREEVPAAALIEPSDWISGGHREEGIMFMAGPGIHPGVRADADIVDVFPTILRILGIPQPGNLDGSSIDAAMSEGFLSANPVQYSEAAAPVGYQAAGDSPYSDEDAERIEARLRGLGYI
jgi:predicted AlkP superfamily phosphohydrolase/phosphomutase